MPKKVTAKPLADGSVLVDELIWKTKEGKYRARRRGRGGQMLTFVKMADAKRHRDSQAEADEPQPAKGTQTLNDVALAYLKANTPTAERATIWSPTTAKARARYWRDLRPTFGHLRPDGATKTVVRNYVAAEREDDAAEGSIKNHMTFLVSLLDYAIEVGAGTKNGARGNFRMEKPPSGWGRARALDDDTADAYIAAMREDFQIAPFLARYCGVRAGEARGLTVDRVDFFRGTVTIDRQLLDHATGHKFKSDEWHDGPRAFAKTKTKTTRVLDVGRDVTDRIAQHLAKYPAPTEGPAFVLSYDGRPVNSSAMRQAWLDAMKPTQGTARFHDLRHTFVTALLDDGVPPATVAELAGHASASITLDVYAHPTAQGRDMARAAIAGRLSRTSGTIQAQSEAANS